MPHAGAIVVAAGKGERMGKGIKKQFRLLAGRPVLHWSLEAMQEATSIDEVVVVTHADDVAWVNGEVAPHFPKVRSVVAGGETRQESVAMGLAALTPEIRWVVVHDGVRPFAGAELVERVLGAAREHGAATAAIPVVDTIKRVDQAGCVQQTLERAGLWAVQTPQAFAREILEQAHAAAAGRLVATDDCGLVEAIGHPVAVVPGSRRNLKLTTEEDLEIMERLAGRYGGGEVTVAGFGFDVHRLVEGRPLVLAGVRIPHSLGLAGHSDADVLAHAVMDALLGACALGDIGQHFPDSDPAYRGADSLKLLEHVSELLRSRAARIVHVDAFVSAEAPKLRPYIDAMRANLARAMAVDMEQVSVKAGTGEGVGTVGLGQVIEARAVATVVRKSPRPE